MLQGRCDYVDNGISAVDLVRESIENCRNEKKLGGAGPHYALILLDYSMPKMDGPTTAQKIRELYVKEKETTNFEPNQPHIVCLTAFTEKIFETKARESGMNEFVSKPITNANLKQILRETRLISLSESLNDL